jgi:hypothetical protein
VRRIAWALTALTAALAAATVAFAAANDGTRLPADEGEEVVSLSGEIAYSLNFVAFAALGGLLASRRPRNPIGWLLCLAPLSLGISGAVTGWYLRAFYAEPGSAAPPEALLWLANWIWVAGFPPLITALLLLFPDGRLPARRWWPAGALVAAALGLMLFGYALTPGPLDDFPRVENPLGVAEGLTTTMVELGHGLLLLSAIASAAALAWRFRRSHGVERQQLKWISTAAALAVVAFIANSVLDQVFGVISNFLLLPFLLALPAAATVAILRYRLYDLGRIVNRTLVYGALTATLAGTYLGLVLLLGLTLGTSDVAIALATLAVAALFRPARARIQAAVDHRFYRRRYDAQRTLDAFGAHLRDEVDVDAVGAALRAAVRDTVQPAHLTLWVPSERRMT